LAVYGRGPARWDPVGLSGRGVTAIILASVIGTVLTAPALNLIGIRWAWAWSLAFLFAFGMGASAAEGLGYF